MSPTCFSLYLSAFFQFISFLCSSSFTFSSLLSFWGWCFYWFSDQIVIKFTWSEYLFFFPQKLIKPDKIFVDLAQQGICLNPFPHSLHHFSSRKNTFTISQKHKQSIFFANQHSYDDDDDEANFEFETRLKGSQN